MSLVKNAFSLANAGQPMVKGCAHCGRLCRDVREDATPEDAVACAICTEAGYKQPPRYQEHLDHPDAAMAALKDSGIPYFGDGATVMPNIKNPTDIATHKPKEEPLTDETRGESEAQPADPLPR